MKFLTTGLCAALAVCAGAARGADWGPVSANGGSETVFVDTASVRRVGEETWFWAKTEYAKPKMNPVLKVLVKTQAQQSLVNCQDDAFAVAQLVFYDADGKLLKSVSWEKDQRHFETVVPGSAADRMLRRACAVATAKATLKPRVLDTPTKGNWRPVATDAAGQASYALLVDNLSVLKDQLLLAIVKIEYAAGAVTDGGVGYHSVVNLIALECQNARADVLISDVYDSNGALVAQTYKAVGEVKLADMRAGSPADKARDLACTIWRKDPQSVKAAGADAQAQEPRVVSGTAWLTLKGYLITAAHVVDGAGKIALMQDGKVMGSAEVVSSDPANDVAVLKPRFKHGVHAALIIRYAPADLGAHVFTLGYPAPDAMGLALKMTSGEISAMTGVSRHNANDIRLLQISVPIQSGNSGGPVIDADGHVVGVVISRLPTVGEDEPAQNVNYALKASYVRSVLAELPNLGGYRRVKPSGGMARLVSELQGAVFMVVARQADEP